MIKLNNLRAFVMFNLLVMLVVLPACTLSEEGDNSSTSSSNNGETARVTRVIDGDTIDVDLNGDIVRIRYVGVNTPERDETCFAEATQANRDLVEGQTVRLERDQSNTDRFDRLLRYVYVGDTFVGAELVRQGVAEVVLYEPDDRNYDLLRNLEQEAARNDVGCHPTGIFDDGTFSR